MSTTIVLQQMAVIAILVLIGVYLYKKGIVDEYTSKRLSIIVMDIVNPALIMSCIITGNMTVSHQQLLVAIGMAIIFYGMLCILGLCIPRILPIKMTDRKMYNVMTVYTNVGFIGIPLAKAMLSDNAMLYVIVCNVMYCLLFYTHGVQVIGGKKSKLELRKLFTPGTIMALLTLVLFWFHIILPPVLANSIIYMGNATVFLSMSLLGVSIAKASIKEGLKIKGLWGYILIRMILVPIGLGIVLKMLSIEREMIQAFCLMASMPVANLPLIQAEKVGEDTALLSQAIVVTTLMSFGTITFVMSLL